MGRQPEKVHFDTEGFPGWTPLARPGVGPEQYHIGELGKGLANKPDLVLEGGNGIRETDGTEADTDDSLLLLTTHSHPTERLLTTMGDTSAATRKQRAWLPSSWRATRTSGRKRFGPARAFGRVDTRDETATVGNAGGQPYPPSSPAATATVCLTSIGQAGSASNLLTLVAQDSLQPFEKRDGGVATKDLSLHALPWPREELSSLRSETVELRVTLSYFIEPNPAAVAGSTAIDIRRTA